MAKLRFKKLRLWLAYPLFIIYPFVARITDISFALGLIFMLIGLGIRFWASGCISKTRTLAISGPYAYTRNPLYLGNFVLGLGITVVSGNIWLITYYLISFYILYLGTIKEEQKVLEEKFGSAYKDYIAHVPVFFPSLMPYEKSDKKKFDINQSFKNGEFIRIIGFSLLMDFFYLYRSFILKKEHFGFGDKLAFSIFVVLFLLLWFNIFLRRKSERKQL